MKEKIKVLVVDDSSVVRQTMKTILESDRIIEVIGTANDPFIAVKKILKEVPDVIILDIQMPKMDGITFLRKIMSQHPIPVVICSMLTEKNSYLVLKALEYGAVEVLQKPRIGTKQFLEESKVLICDAIKAASQTKPKRISDLPRKRANLIADSVLREPIAHEILVTTDKVIVVGASTGGTEALRYFLSSMPLDSPGMVIVQHMPEHFTAAFAKSLDRLCRISVKEAENGDSILKGRALIAPGNRHTTLKRSGTKYYVEVKDGPLVSRHRPSVDVLFHSTSRYAGKNAIGIIMTGMGNDGARGLKDMKDSGAKTIAQDKKSSVVFGMPHEAIKLGCVDHIVSLDAIPQETIKLCRE
jgi:two-component system chemotaxis response regulator CheB